MERIKMKHLFVGGHSDGKTLSIHFKYGPRPVRIPVPPSIPYWHRLEANAEMSTIKIEDYVPLRFQASGKEFVIYALESLNAGDVLAKLINEYSKKL
jgi:hypothetical protein